MTEYTGVGEKQLKTCAVCKKKSSCFCARCGLTSYCSKECQKVRRAEKISNHPNYPKPSRNLVELIGSKNNIKT